MAESKNKVLKKARKEMKYLTGDAAVERLEFLKEKWEMDYNSGMDYATECGKKEGEKKAKLQIALELIRNNIPENIIMNSTGLSKKEIEKIKSQI